MVCDLLHFAASRDVGVFSLACWSCASSRRSLSWTIISTGALRKSLHRIEVATNDKGKVWLDETTWVWWGASFEGQAFTGSDDETYAYPAEKWEQSQTRVSAEAIEWRAPGLVGAKPAFTSVEETETLLEAADTD
jgi:hypothetical protein